MKNILVVVDMQKDFVDGALGTSKAVAIKDAVIEEIYSDKYDAVYATLDTHETDYLQTAEGQKLPVEHCIKDTDGWMFDEDIADALPDDTLIVEKPTFGSVELAESLYEMSLYEDISIYLCGLCTDICVISNALLCKAYMPEVPIAVIADACAGVTPESHQNALAAMKMCQIDII